MTVRCGRCSKEILSVNGVYFVPCPCRKLEIERLNELHGGIEIDSVSIHEILPFNLGICVPMKLNTDEGLEDWRGDKES